MFYLIGCQFAGFFAPASPPSSLSGTISFKDAVVRNLVCLVDKLLDLVVCAQVKFDSC